MQGPLTNLVSQLIPGLPASGAGKSSALQGKEKGAFFEVLTLLSSGTSGPKTAAVTGDGSRTDDALSNLAELLPALLTSGTGDLSQGLQMIAGNGAGIERSSPPSANNSDASSNSGSSGKTGRSVEALLSALAALFGAKGMTADGGSSARDNLPSGASTDNRLSAGEASTGTDSHALSDLDGRTKGVEDTTNSSDNSVDQKDQGRGTKDDLQMLALLVFNSLEAVLQTQPRETPTGQDSATTKTDGLPSGAGQISGVNGGPGQEMIYQALVERFSQSKTKIKVNKRSTRPMSVRHS
ncbi:MAG: hypothetical protein ABSD38_04795 [Syntrophorhabdales bacterium]